MDDEAAKKIAERFLHFCETNEQDGLFDEDVLADINVPEWRFQMQGVADVVGWMKGELPDGSRVPSWRSDPTASGVVVEVEQWYDRDGQEISSRNLHLRYVTARSRNGRCTARASGTQIFASARRVRRP